MLEERGWFHDQLQHQRKKQHREDYDQYFHERDNPLLLGPVVLSMDPVAVEAATVVEHQLLAVIHSRLITIKKKLSEHTNVHIDSQTCHIDKWVRSRR